MLDIKTDSRKVKQGDTFVALRGINSDGHDYIENAIKNGAKKIIAEQGSYSVSTKIVPDTRRFLNSYLKDTYNNYLNRIQIVGITGTNGKTTVGYLLNQALNHLKIKSAFVGTNGFYLGNKKISDLENSTPDICDLYDYIIQAIDNDCDYIIIEVSSHALVNGRVETLDFNHAIFTNLTEDHLDYHNTMENYVLAKQKLFKKIKINGTAIINYDDQLSSNFMFPNNHNITYGFTGGDFKIVNPKYSIDSTIFDFVYRNDTYQVNSNLVGEYNVYDLMPVIIFLLCIGVNPIKVLKTIYSLEAPKGRLEMIKYNNNLVVIDYAHTAQAIEKTVETVKEFVTGNIYIVFGCVGQRDRVKRPIMTRVVSKMSKEFIITSDDVYFEDPNQIVNDMLVNKDFDNYIVVMDRKLAIIKGIDMLEENDCLLILGKGDETIWKVRERRIPFNDKNIATEYIEAISK